MSVFRNIGLDAPPIQGLDYDDWPVTVGVARGLVDEIRLALRGAHDSEVILKYSDVRRLINLLKEAIEAP